MQVAGGVVRASRVELFADALRVLSSARAMDWAIKCANAGWVGPLMAVAGRVSEGGLASDGDPDWRQDV